MFVLLCLATLPLFSPVFGYETVCYGDLGCFTDAPPYGDTEERPFGHTPNHPEDINTRFYLGTRFETEREVYNTDMDNLECCTSFDASKPTKFIVHGFIHYGEVQWLKDMSQDLLSIGDFNVIRVGWIGGSLTLNYAKSATDTQVVGAEIGLFVKNILERFGGSAADFHCIGHSLGAQTCGYAGKFLDGTLGRISGLDPAGPYFENTPVEVRLDSSDALFVDVIHSDAEKLSDLAFGTNQVSGHVDFWPNNGIDQPGCNLNALSTIVGGEGIKIGVQNFVACSHLRAVYFYLESITSPCKFIANPCSSYEDYLGGKCLACDNGVCAAMGYHAIDAADTIQQSTTPNFYLKTAALPAYCENTVYIQVTLGSSGDSIDGKLYLSLYDRTTNSEQKLVGDEKQILQLRPSTTYSYLTQFRKIPNNFDRVKLLWMQEEFTITNQRITLAQITVYVSPQQKLYTFCGDGSTKMAPETRYLFHSC